MRFCGNFNVPLMIVNFFVEIFFFRLVILKHPLVDSISYQDQGHFIFDTVRWNILSFRMNFVNGISTISLKEVCVYMTLLIWSFKSIDEEEEIQLKENAIHFNWINYLNEKKWKNDEIIIIFNWIK